MSLANEISSIYSQCIGLGELPNRDTNLCLQRMELVRYTFTVEDRARYPMEAPILCVYSVMDSTKGYEPFSGDSTSPRRTILVVRFYKL